MATPSSGTISADNNKKEYFNSYGGEISFDRIGWLTNASGGSSSNFAMNEMYGQTKEPITSGLIHHSDIVNPASNSGGSTMSDISGNGNDWTSSNGFYQGSYWGYPPYAYFMNWSFYGNGAIANLAPNTNFTIECWIRPYPGEYQGVAGNCERYSFCCRYPQHTLLAPYNYGGNPENGGSVGWGFYVDSWGTQDGYGGDNFGPSNYGYSYSPSTSNFSHLVWGCSGNSSFLYVNGSAVTTSYACWGNTKYMDTRWMLGNPGVGNHQYIGMYQGFRCWNRVLSGSEISTMFNNQRNRYGI